MSRSTHTRGFRGLAGAGLLMVASLVAPRIGLAQGAAVAEHALLNRVPVRVDAWRGANAVFHLAGDPAAGATSISGEQALLNRTGPVAWSIRHDGTAAVPRRRPEIDGKAALLGTRD